MTAEAAMRLALSAPGPALDLLFGKPDPWPAGIPDTSPASYPPDHRDAPDWIDAREAADLIGCQIEHVWRLGREGTLERRKGRKYVRFLRSSVVDYATSGEPTRVTIDVRRPRPRPRQTVAR